MSIAEQLPIEPMDPRIKTIQPGGGVICQLEQAWGYVRRFWLKRAWPGYVKRMAACRKGDFNPCPHEVLDPRDLKFYQNQGGYYWDAADDPFQWRNSIPFARVGLAELLVFSIITFGPAIPLGIWLGMNLELGFTPLTLVAWFVFANLLIYGILIVWFFRDPPRTIPTQPGLVVAPADGKVVEIREIEHDPFIGGPAVQIGIFLSIFNVHINRVPATVRVIGLTYQPGKFLNALRPSSAKENEQVALRLQETEAPYRRYIVRQITGALARRIVCVVKPGDVLPRGAQFGMIKLGSRTELVLPKEAGLKILAKIGDKIQAGSTVLAEYQA
jgi:phosphatidylserine decarboxylase